MSRGQSGQAFDTAQGQESTDQGESQESFSGANAAIENYQNSLSKFVSSNPYTSGGEYDRTILPALSQTEQAGASSVRGALQSNAARTGENAAGSAASAASAEEQSTRDLATEEAGAEQTRISDEAGYNQQGVQMASEPISAEEGLFGTSTSGANSAEGNATNAAKTPSFWDTLGDSFASGLGKGLGGGGGGHS